MRKVLLATMLLACAGFASALTVTQTQTVPMSLTDWTDALIFNQFDSSMGTLQSVDVTVKGVLEGLVQFENKNKRNGATQSGTVAATVTVYRPDMSTIVLAATSVADSATLGAFDGTIDFTGASGYTSSILTDSATQSANLTSAGDLAAFTGMGTIVLPVDALGISSSAGTSNVVFSSTSDAAAEVTVVYNYIPEPATLGILGLGALLAVRRKA